MCQYQIERPFSFCSGVGIIVMIVFRRRFVFSPFDPIHSRAPHPAFRVVRVISSCRKPKEDSAIQVSHSLSRLLLPIEHLKLHY